MTKSERVTSGKRQGEKQQWTNRKVFVEKRAEKRVNFEREMRNGLFLYNIISIAYLDMRSIPPLFYVHHTHKQTKNSKGQTHYLLGPALVEATDGRKLLILDTHVRT